MNNERPFLPILSVFLSVFLSFCQYIDNEYPTLMDMQKEIKTMSYLLTSV